MSNSGNLDSIDYVVHSAPAEWWEIVAAIGPYLVIIAVAAGALVHRLLRPAPRHDFTSAKASAGWGMAQWAMEAAMDPDPKRRKRGRAVLEQLSGSHLLDEDSSRIVEQAKRLLKGD